MAQFVDELPGPAYRSVRTPHLNRDRKPEAKMLLDFAAALKARPMTWAIWPKKITPASAGATASRVREGFYRSLKPEQGFEAASRDGVVYVRFNPDRVTGDPRETVFREGYDRGYEKGLEDLGLIIEKAFQYARREVRILKGDEGPDEPIAFHVRGEDHPCAKLTERQVRDIRQGYDDGTSVQDLAAKHKVSAGVVYSVLTRESWRHVRTVNAASAGQE